MSNFTVVVHRDREYIDSHQFSEIAECTLFARNCDYCNMFDIHKEKVSDDFLRGEKKSNGYIDWVRTPY